MKDETRKQVREFYAGVARLTGAVSAIFAIWYGGVILARLFAIGGDSSEPVGGAVVAMSIFVVLALLLLNVRAERPKN